MHNTLSGCCRDSLAAVDEPCCDLGASVDTDQTPRILFLSWGCPWPALAGGTLRTLGLLKELSRSFAVDLLVLGTSEPSAAQQNAMQSYIRSIRFVPMAGRTFLGRLSLLRTMLLNRVPYHCAVIRNSFAQETDMLDFLRAYPGLIYANYGQWGSLALDCTNACWILDQQNSDVQLWKAYMKYARGVMKLVAAVNWALAAHHYPHIYESVRKVISVCEEDKRLTLQLSPQASVDVIENGVDCEEFSPNKRFDSSRARVLFTGTSAQRNIKALHDFCSHVWPAIKQRLPQAELLVAGRFTQAAQKQFAYVADVRFTGFVEDIRPCFDESDVFISPFHENHGSKLKIAEAMAMAMPIVSTPEGVRGFALKHKVSALIADTDTQFVTYVVDLLSTPDMRTQLGEAARQVALQTIDWPVLGARLRRIVEQIFCEQRSADERA